MIYFKKKNPANPEVWNYGTCSSLKTLKVIYGAIEITKDEYQKVVNGV